MDGSTLGVKKVLVTVIWGIKGFYIVDFLPEGESFDTPHFVDYVLTPLKDKKESIWPSSRSKRMWLHLDNCSVFNSQTSFQKYDEYGNFVFSEIWCFFRNIKTMTPAHTFCNKVKLIKNMLYLL